MATRTDRRSVTRHSGFRTIGNYLEVLKPRESSLLTFIGICSAFIAGNGSVSLGKILLISAAVLLCSAGANGLTNYLDRDIDARMERTRHRALPSRRIYPAEKVLPLVVGLSVIGLIIAWQLHPYSFVAGLVGTIAAVVWRKRWTCVFPQGVLASCAPVLMAWLAVDPAFSWQLFLMCLLIALWLPIHLWSVMTACRDDYYRAGIRYFPVNRETGKVVKILLAFSLLLYAVTIIIYFTGDFKWFFLLFANLLGGVLIYTSIRLVRSTSTRGSWKLYKLSAFPYLGLVFTAMSLCCR